MLSPHGDSTAAVQSGWSCCVERRHSKSPCCSRRNASAWHLLTTEIFTVPLLDLYQSSFIGYVCHSLRALCTLTLCQASYLTTDPSRPHSSCLIMRTNTCASCPPYAAHRIVFSELSNVKAAHDGGTRQGGSRGLSPRPEC